MKKNMKQRILVSSIALALGSANAEAALVTDLLGPYSWSTDRANMTWLSTSGFIVAGTNDVAVTWDGDGYNSSSDYTGPGSVSNMTSWTTPFFGYSLAVHDIQMFTPGNYSFDTTLGGGNAETGTMNVTVGAGQLGMHMLWDWNGNNNVDVFIVMDLNSVFGSGVGTNFFTSPCTATTKNCLWTGKGWVGDLASNAPTGGQTWMLASADGNGDGIMGIPMRPDGPTGGFNFNFNANFAPVPVPAAVWLFGSGLMGLVAAARRRKTPEM